MFFLFLCIFLDLDNETTTDTVKYYTSLYGSNSGTCNEDSPCSFSKILKIAKKGNLVYIKDNEYNRRKDLREFQKTAINLLNKSVGIVGNPTFLNGSEAGNNYEYFLSCHEIKAPVIVNFSFKYFKNPVLLINGAENAELINLSFSHNYLSSSYAIVAFTVSQISLENIEIYENTVNSCNVLLMVTASILGSNFSFLRNFATGKTIEPLINIINTGLLLENLLISGNSATDCPLIFVTSRASLIGLNCQIIKNAHPEIIVNDGSANYTFAFSNIAHNRGTFFEGTFESFIHFTNSNINDNFSPTDPFFYMPSGVFSLNETIVQGNHGKYFVLMENSNSSIILANSTSNQNSFDNALFQLGQGSSLLFNTSISNTFSKVSFINTTNSEVCLDNVKTDNLITPLVINNNGSIHYNNNNITNDLKFAIQGKNNKFTNSTFKELEKNPTTPSMIRAYEHLSIFNSEFSFESLIHEYYNLLHNKDKNQTKIEDEEKMKDIFNDPASYDQNTLEKITEDL